MNVPVLVSHEIGVAKGRRTASFSVGDGLTALLHERESHATALSLILAGKVGGKPVDKALVADDMTTFGTGLSPFFLSLSLWLGSLIMYMVFKPLNRRAVDSGASPLRAALTVAVPGLLMSFLQATWLSLVQTLAIGITPVSLWGYYAALVGIGFAFNMVVLTIYAFFGATVGRVIAMALLPLQLVSSNGIYPPEVQPAFIQWVHSWDPLRYSVDLLRHVMVGSFSGDPRPEVAIVVLVCCFVGGLGIVVLANWRERVMMRKDLHPELAL